MSFRFRNFPLILGLCMTYLLSGTGSYEDAVPTFELAIALFRKEKSRDCSQFIQECNALQSFSERNLLGTQESPMVLQVKAILARVCRVSFACCSRVLFACVVRVSFVCIFMSLCSLFAHFSDRRRSSLRRNSTQDSWR